MLMSIAIAAGIMGAIGVFSAAFLGVAGKVFAIVRDPKVDELEEALVGANCGACGYSGCAAAAQAVVEGRAKVNVCLLGGAETAERAAEVMGVDVTAEETPVATLGCNYGVDNAHLLFDYRGIKDCRAAAMVLGGGKVCAMGCLGLGTCVRACNFGALRLGDNGLPVVDKDKCIACGACEASCPKGIIKLSSTQLRIAHQQESTECLAPCEATCPAQIDIPLYIRSIAEGDYRQAITTIKEHNPFPLVCGRVCPHPCEAACRRGDHDEPIAINPLKRFAADYEMNLNERILPNRAPSTGKKIAVVGSGPSGLTCAYYLSARGHEVKVFEAMPKPGGMLRYGIPDYRLPQSVLDWEIGGVEAMGVEIQCNTALGKDISLEQLEEEYDAVYLAMGAWKSRAMRIEGEDDYPEIESGIAFLEKLAKGERPELGDEVVIVGGGNTAMDCARSSLRLGAANVYLLYRRSRAEMPAAVHEVNDGEFEGIQYHFLSAPIRAVGTDNSLRSLEFQRMRLEDHGGRPKPVPIEGDIGNMKVTNLIAAIGQGPDLTALGTMVDATKWETVLTEIGTCQTNREKTFAGGDFARGGATVVEGVRDGRDGARAIHLFLNGEDMNVPENYLAKPPKFTGVKGGFEVLPTDTPRVEVPVIEKSERVSTFAEVEITLNEEQAKQEAARCLQCGEVCFKGHRGKRS
ncbi:MAG: FAD-dependent oxidoreductase [Deltaproteobacteria bacterium]|nr:FAD-dependent oxidoreductase [Deltaproteobacteria bacterium]MBN2670107.1 FAD-dependent oxidoreductase [Deltaproteobacteria bacterium]